MIASGEAGPAWTFVGVCAVGLLCLALFAQHLASRRPGRKSLSTVGCILTIVGAFVLAIYAIAIRQWVFLAAQLLFLLLALRHCLATMSTPPAGSPEMVAEHGSPLPVVSPDSAERKLSDL